MKNPETQSPENMKNENDLIPCTDELNRLKEFLADFKKPALRYTGEDHWIVGIESPDEVRELPGPHRWCDYCGEYLKPFMAGTCNICGTKH